MKLKSLSNVVRIAINDDPARVIEFNPDDVGFVERFYALIDNVEAKENEIKEKLEEIRKDQTESPYGMPNSIRREVQLTAEMCRYMREQIDNVFGAGSSQTIFGDVNVPTMFGEFFTLIGPCISSARSGAVKKYTAKKKATPK